MRNLTLVELASELATPVAIIKETLEILTETNIGEEVSARLQVLDGEVDVANLLQQLNAAAKNKSVPLPEAARQMMREARLAQDQAAEEGADTQDLLDQFCVRAFGKARDSLAEGSLPHIAAQMLAGPFQTAADQIYLMGIQYTAAQVSRMMSSGMGVSDKKKEGISSQQMELAQAAVKQSVQAALEIGTNFINWGSTIPPALEGSKNSKKQISGSR